MSSNHLHQWSSRWAFIMAATGSAVGLGNLWKFPYMAGENGGGAFVVTYLLCVLFIGIPILMAEIMLGRRGGVDPIHCTWAVAVESKRSKHWRLIGILGMLASFLLLSYYAVIAGFAMAYVPKALFGVFEHATGRTTAQLFQAFQSHAEVLLFWDTLFLVCTMSVVLAGVKAGIERFISLVVPMLFFILLVLVVYALLTTGQFTHALQYLFLPKVHDLSWQGFLFALGHSFFTLSIATASMLIYGCYLDKTVSIARSALSIACLDTLTALLAGLAIFPLVFAHHLSPDSGPSLVFQTLPIAFGHMPLGQIIGALFFMLLSMAALGSAISMLEPIVAWVARGRKSRFSATVGTTCAVWLCSIGSVLSFSHWDSVLLNGNLNYYELIDNVVSVVLLPLGGFMMAVFCGWFMRTSDSQQELAMTYAPIYQLWLFSVRYIAPLTVTIVTLQAMRQIF